MSWWRPDPAPRQYDCRLHPRAHLWMGVCEQPAAKYASHQNTRRMAAAVALQPTATRLLRLLDNRTTVVIGDSHSLNLWCALTCWLLSEGAELSLGASAAGPALVTRLPPYEARWLLPACASTGRPHCGDAAVDHPACGAQELERLATVAATEPLVVLHNPCGAYAGDHVRKAVQAALKRAPSLERLASHADPVRALCGATCAHPSLDRTKYRSLVAAAAGRLERISKARRSLGILALSPFTHFPEVEGALATLGLDELIDGAGSYDRFALSSIVWLAAQLRHNHTELIRSSLGFQRPGWSNWKQGTGNFDPSLAVGVSRRCATTDASCLPTVLTSRMRAAGPTEVRRVLRSTECEARAARARGPNDDWRQEIERDAARAAGIPLLDTQRARLERWDAHPGIQGGRPERGNNVLDCAHAAAVPGGFDGELVALFDVLERV